jgi:hypothetical protein
MLSSQAQRRFTLPAFEKVTSDANELVFGTLLDGYRRLTIPLFQRSYQWGRKEFLKFQEDLEAVVSTDASTRFIGAIVAVERPYGPNFPTEYEIVDGQQRLFTIYLTIAAAAWVTAKRGDANAAALLLRRYLYLPDLSDSTWNTKLSTSLDDAHEFVDLWKEILGISALIKALGTSRPRPPAAPGDAKRSKRILGQFDRLRKWMEAVWKERGAPGVTEYVGAATSNLSFVWLSLQDPSSAPKIFESLNNRGMRTTVGDLVRNEVFARLREDPEQARSLYDHEWREFMSKLEQRYEAFFFPYGLIVNRNAKKSELFATLRALWKADVPAATIIADMSAYVAPFLALAAGTVPAGASPSTARAVETFRRFKLPSAVYPFLMQLLHEAFEGRIAEMATIEVLHSIESFLVRRALCGFEPTGLHAVFKGLWQDLGGDLSSAAIRAKIGGRKTIQWPSSEQVRIAIATKALYGGAVAHYVLAEYDRSLGGDAPQEEAEIEHILPQKLSKHWATVFTADQHEKLKDVWANLVPLTPPMNKELQQAVYEIKRVRFREDSMYKTPRSVAQAFDVWTPASIAARTALLQDFAVQRWPI